MAGPMKATTTELGRRLREARLAVGMTGDEAMEATGLSGAFISRAETGETPNPGILGVLKLCKAYQISIVDITYGLV
jgi:transcriptional regulator with XRE-family HTH domain